MSVRMTARVWEMQGLGPYKWVLLRLADHANADGRCYPGQASLADDCEISERSVRRAVNILDRLGLVERLRRHRRSPQEYQLHLPEIPGAIHWAAWVEKVADDAELRLGYAWFDQDRPQVAGQTSIDLGEPENPRPATDLSAQPGGLDRPQDRPQDRPPVTVRPATGDLSLKGTASEPLEPRALRLGITEAHLRELAFEKAKQRGAYNAAGLAAKIAREDRELLLAELVEAAEAQARLHAIGECEVCDDRGFAWDEASNTAIRCKHPDLEADT